MRLLGIIENGPESLKKWPQISTVRPSLQTIASLCFVKEPINFISDSKSTIFYSVRNYTSFLLRLHNV